MQLGNSDQTLGKSARVCITSLANPIQQVAQRSAIVLSQHSDERSPESNRISVIQRIANLLKRYLVLIHAAPLGLSLTIFGSPLAIA